MRLRNASHCAIWQRLMSLASTFERVCLLHVVCSILPFIRVARSTSSLNNPTKHIFARSLVHQVNSAFKARGEAEPAGRLRVAADKFLSGHCYTNSRPSGCTFRATFRSYLLLHENENEFAHFLPLFARSLTHSTDTIRRSTATAAPRCILRSLLECGQSSQTGQAPHACNRRTTFFSIIRFNLTVDRV